MNKREIFGLSAALVTPFGVNGAVDLLRLVAHAKHVLANGCDSVTLFGTTGEGFSLDMRDRAAMLGAMAGAGFDLPARVNAGVSATTVADAVDQSRLALDMGARGLLFAPPYYFKNPDEEGLYAWFSRAIEGIGAQARGIILYHIPGQTAVGVSVDLVDRLKRAFPGVITGVKDSSGDWPTAEAFLKAHGELAILIGDERLLARGVRLGAEGSICGLANLAPALLRPLVHEGRDDERVTRLVDLIVSYPVLPAVKALVGHLHGDHGFGPMRPPLTELAPARAAALAAAFDAILSGEQIRKSA
jgi:4-hydroxy-tetrahydrodipicolinate synthase